MNQNNQLDPMRLNNQMNPMGLNPAVQVDPYAEQQINQGIANGFGQFFFNALDPNIAKTNVPIKK